MTWLGRERRDRAAAVGAPLGVIACLALAGIAAVTGVARRSRSSTDDVKSVVTAESDSLDRALARLDSTLGDTLVKRHAIVAAFRETRTHYKHLEGVVEFYAPALAAAFNSRRQEVDDDDAPPPSTLGPSGFPALEALLWPTLERAQRDSAQRVVQSMHGLVRRARALASAITATNSQLIELTRLELVRVSTVGIAGFDAPRTGEAMRECAAAIDGVRNLYLAAGARWPMLDSPRKGLDSNLVKASQYLRAHNDFESFDRLEYLVKYSEPASRALDQLRRDARAVAIAMPRPLRAGAISPYDANAFDPIAYAPRTSPSASAAITSLGERLFFDPQLSGTGTRSCASCHHPDKAFSDGLATPSGVDPHGARVTRNTPTLINAALQPAQFDDERAVTLEDQVLEVLRSKTEMASSAERVARIVTRDSSYRSQFSKAFHDSTGVSPLRVRQALAAYVRTLVSLDSRFDSAVRGDTTAITAQERRGFNLFMGKAGCGTCHFAPLFGGSAPPLYTRSDVEVIGTSSSPAAFGATDTDSGRARIDHRPEHLRAFKVPSLRNVMETAPYMHNGTFRTLDDVMHFYEAGGGQGAGGRIPNQTLAPDSLRLTASERAAIIAFLGTLSSRP